MASPVFESPETCRGRNTTVQLPGGWRTGLIVPCLTTSQGARPHRPRLRGDTNVQRWWVRNPAEAQAIADDAEVTVASLLCVGCQRMLARLVRAGQWP